MTNTIYIGQTLWKKGVFHNEIFTGRPVELIADLKKDYPLIENLFVSVEEYAEARAEMLTAGTAKAVANAQTAIAKK